MLTESSLPLNIDHGELGKMLAEHLSEHTQVKNIKVIRDSKGGICAFVQCENADAASGLIQTLRTTTPKPFLGRILRYEPARAFRTLLVSYRAPSYLIPGYGSPGRQNPWELPTALRLWKTKGSRFHHIAYNSDAEVAELRRTEQKLDAAESNSLHLQPLKFDEFSLHKLAAYFGRLESFALYRPEEDAPSSEVPNVGNAHPGPHSAPRLPCMDNGCWEVKWDFRDDCVGALMALRRVPHLTVTWAHLPFSSGGDLHLAQFKHPQYFQPAPYSHQASPLLPPFPYSTSPTAGVVSQSGYNKGDVIKPHQEVLVVGPPQDFRNQAHIPLVTVGWAPPSKSELMPSTSFKPVVAFTDMTAPPIDVYEWPSYTIEKQRATEERHHSACYPQSTASPIVRPTSGDDPQIVYPLTPTSWAASDDDHLDAPQKSEDMRDAEAQNIDPTSLFIGGLNVLGSFPWTEERVREHFSKYGGLENVKFVRPFNATTAFAFLKYNNTEGPARAVQEEHNRTCDGRVLRVQLRDCNPPRNPWKNGRGRGRFPTNHSFSHRGHHFPTKFVPRSNCLPKESAAGSEALSNRNEAEHPGTATSLEGSPSPYVSEASPTSDDRTLHDATPSPSLAASDDGAFKGSASSRSDAQDHSEKYREWYDDLEPTTNHTWLPSSASMNTIPPPGYPCVYPNGPFYTTPTTWVPTQVYQAPYPMPYYPVCPGMHPSQALPPQGDYDPNWSASAVVYQVSLGIPPVALC
ncbi:hypothetical protein FA15DRAFT_35998 [Coprinopsis marcescibilis]|uniref:RRM domain-containing protein n=1 Tax=Coprinopsis marcescibilis TaxID=230819 RepID=A0A5C3LDH6_COPMA|nr:hypothetical protein FA15DRAFT_35998 [Coprinopsis marcescibilis]